MFNYLHLQVRIFIEIIIDKTKIENLLLFINIIPVLKHTAHAKLAK